MIEETSRSLPPLVLHPTTAVLLLLLIRAAMKTPHLSGRLLLSIVWLRYVMQAYHEWTYISVGGLSINAIASLAVCGAGGLLLMRRLPELLRFPVIATLVGVIILSGLINGVAEPTFETLLKWGYFAVILLAVLDCMEKDGDHRILGLLLWAFAPPLVYQALSIGLGVSRDGESDGSVSYIGGYNHEAAFSVILVTCFAVAALAPRTNLFLRLCLLAACIVGLFAANYRTSLIALAPLAVGYFVFGIAQSVAPGRRVIVSLLGLLIMSGGAIAANAVVADRMADLSALGDSQNLVRAPEEFSEADRKLLSGRLYIWNLYVDQYSAGRDPQLVFGYGADSWIDRFGVYAHNTFVSYLFEFGVVGAVLVVLVLLGMLVRAFRIRDWSLRGQLVCTHLGFICLCMATMPFWQIEGLILYGIICGYTVVLTSQRAPARRRGEQAAGWVRARRGVQVSGMKST